MKSYIFLRESALYLLEIISKGLSFIHFRQLQLYQLVFVFLVGQHLNIDNKD